MHKVSLLQKLINTNAEEEAKELAEKEAHMAFVRDHEAWEKETRHIEEARSRYNKEYQEWLKEKTTYEEKISNEKKTVKEMMKCVEKGDALSIARLHKYIIDNSILPFRFSFSSSAEYQAESQRLVIDVDIPTISDLPTVKNVKYIKSRDEIDFKYQTDSYKRKLYDKVIYQVVLLLIHHCFECDHTKDYINAVALNGYVRTVDPASGKEIHPCILSVSTERESYEDLILASVDAKAWFKSVKGVAAAKIEMSTPVPPIIALNKEDHRFVDSYDVANQLDTSTNLASMDWKDFENLVRELFEKEFSVNGGEVKVTQASRDGGVDAVAFDPDPIRGGKIVIQAKRYTNVVGVSAVRDLYGTVMNEGANKGILVTTSGYGNDAYEFAKGKPITLLDGGNLLSLLEKHGHKARIDIKEAKELL